MAMHLCTNNNNNKATKKAEMKEVNIWVKTIHNSKKFQNKSIFFPQSRLIKIVAVLVAESKGRMETQSNNNNNNNNNNNKNPKV